MCTVITDLSQVSPKWLTQVLREHGFLPCGEVTKVDVAAESAYTSTVAHLTLTYSDAAPPAAPTRLFLKLSRLDSRQRVVGSAQRKHEVDFHNRVVVMMPCLPLVRCYQAVYCPQTGMSHLLFDDVSETHFGVKSDSPPGKLYCDSVIDSFAAFHAFWWDHAALPAVESFPNQESVADDIAAIRKHFPSFVDLAGARLSTAQRGSYESVLRSLPGLLQRVIQGKHLTLIHGDANLSNVLLPCATERGTALIIDWQLWGIGFAAHDLSNLIALFWRLDDRRAMEKSLLRRYHEGLIQHGVRDYTWEDCWYDYRLAVIVRILFMPMWFWLSGAPSTLVWTSLEKAMQAFDDLGCVELLDD